MEKIGSSRMGARDFRGRPLMMVKVRRLRKYNVKWGVSVRSEFVKELERLRSVMGIPKPCVEQALEIYRQALKKEMSISEAFAAAALYMACRMMKMPRPLDELVRYTKASREKVARCYRLLLRELDVKVPISDPVLYISRIAEQLKLSGEVVKTAVEILQKAKRAGITAGKAPAGLAAAALYMASLMHGDNRTQKDFAAAAGVSNVTVKKRYYELLRATIKQLKDIQKEVEVKGKKYKVKVIGGGAAEEDRGGRKLLRIRIAAEVDGVRREYTITFGKYGRDNTAIGRAHISAGAPGGREADAERLSALIKVLTGREPKVIRRSDGRIEVVCSRVHLEGFRRFAELADAVERWLRQ